MFLIEDVLGWLRLLPNVTRLNVDLSEMTLWLHDESMGRDLHSSLARLEHLHVTCSTVADDMLDGLLTYLVDSGHFSRLRRLRFAECPNLSLKEDGIRRWTQMISVRSNQHQLAFLKINFLDEEYLVPDLQPGYEINVIDHDQSSVEVHRHVRPGYVSFWMDRSAVGC